MNTNLYLKVTGTLGDAEATTVDHEMRGCRGIIALGALPPQEGFKPMKTMVLGEMGPGAFEGLLSAMIQALGKREFIRLALRALRRGKRGIETVEATASRAGEDAPDALDAAQVNQDEHAGDTDAYRG